MSILTNKNHLYDPIWHVQIAVAFALLLQLALPDRLLVGSRYIVPTLEVALLIILAITTPKEPIYRSLPRRIAAISLIALISVSNIYALVMVANGLLAGGQISNGRELIAAAINIFLTNVIIFGLWYWELDGGGPGRRRGIAHHERDFLFPQMTIPELKHVWHPTFIDYLYVSSTNATAFSPTDTMPLTRRTKMLMLLQSVASLITLALVAARAVNILS